MNLLTNRSLYFGSGKITLFVAALRRGISYSTDPFWRRTWNGTAYVHLLQLYQVYRVQRDNELNTIGQTNTGNFS